MKSDDIEIFASAFNDNSAEIDMRCCQCLGWLSVPDCDHEDSILLSEANQILAEHDCPGPQPSGGNP